MKKLNRQRLFMRTVAALLILPINLTMAATPLSDAPIFSVNTVKPNIMFTLDNSGSMAWSFMPDPVVFNRGNRCYKNSIHNGVYYDPTITYAPPLTSTGSSYPNSSFTAAWNDGYNTGAGTTNLNTTFRAYDNVTSAGNGADTAQPAYYAVLNGVATPDPATCYANAQYSLVVINNASPAAVKQNFANWYSYYRTRMLMAKSSIGAAFYQVDPNPLVAPKFRVGFNTINDGSGNPSSIVTNGTFWQNISDFTPTQKSTWFSRLYGSVPNGGTPLRVATDKIGKHYAGTMGSDPIQYSCQKNYHILSTDGYWNESFGGIGNQDNVNSGYSTRAYGAFDGGLGGATNTLADVAMYYYKTDLRGAMTNNVPTDSKDIANHQHVTMFTIGLGANGAKPYREDYDSALAGFFADVKSGADNWPVPVGNANTTIDDLWHAAVNGRGSYLSAKNPTGVATGLLQILNEINASTQSATGASLSSPVLTASNNKAYKVRYKNSDWTGEIFGVVLDPLTGLEVVPVVPPLWDAQALLDAKVSGTGWDTNRKIVTVAENGTKIPFRWASFPPGGSSQTALVSSDVLNFLRGEKKLVNSAPVYRDRPHILGDIVGSRLAVVDVPKRNYNEAVNPGYKAFKVAQASRPATLYVGANDGMLHAFDATTGQETWAFIPSFVIRPGLDGIAALSYKKNGNPAFAHHFYVDGSPEVGDIDFNRTDGAAGAPLWKTLLVGGLNKGGRGYYALDVTTPAASSDTETSLVNKILWQFTDPNMGYTFGVPLIMKTKGYGWVVMVTSGYNNVPAASGGAPGSTTGDGRGYLYILNARTGALIHTLSTGQGTVAAPSGLAQINGFTTNLEDMTVDQVYGGDLNGNLWRFNLTDPVKTNWTTELLATLRDAGGTAQPITTLPQISVEPGNKIKRWVFAGTGKLLDTTDIAVTATQTFYAIKDGTKAIPSPVVSGSPIVRSDLTPVSGVGTPASITTKGWYIDLTAGERIHVDPVADLGLAAFVTSTPNSTDPCASGLSGNLYARNYSSGESALKSGASLITNVSSPGGFVSIGFIKTAVPSPAQSLKLRAEGANGVVTLVDPVLPPKAPMGRATWREFFFE